MNKINKFSPIIFLFILMIFFWKYFPGDIAVSDELVRIKQVKDFLASDTEGFSCKYPGFEIDKDYKYIPSLHPILRIFNNKCYYVFPYFFTILSLPFFIIGKVKALYIMTLLCGFITFIHTIKLGDLFIKSNLDKFILRILVFTSMGVLYYSLKLNEHIVASTLSVLGVYLFFKNKSSINLIFSGLLLGLSPLIRQESILLGFSLIFFSFLKDKKLTKENLSISLSFIFILSLSVCANLLLFGEPLGLRGMEIKEKSSFDLYQSLQRINIYLIGNGDRGLFKFFPVYVLGLLTPILFLKNRNIPLALILISIPALFIIPVIVTIDPFGQFGERYLYIIYPFLLILTCIFLAELRNKNIKIFFNIIALISCIYTFRIELKLIKENYNFLKFFKIESNNNFSSIANDKIIVIRNLYLNSFFFNNPNQNQIVFMAVSDENFLSLLQLLRKNSINKITIISTKLKITDIDPELFSRHNGEIPNSDIPLQANKFLKSRSIDKGSQFVKIMEYDLN